MKKLLYLIVMIVVLGLIVSGCIPVVPPAGQDEPELLPNKSSGDVLNVTTSNSYSTIQAAIDAANPGDTISVGNGIYPESIKIGKANLILQSETSLGAIIRPTTTPASWPEAVIYITADGVTVDGFEVDGTTVADNGILGWETSDLTIKNNKIHGAVRQWDGCGILLFSWGNGGTVYNNHIENNEVYDTGRMGIMVMDKGANYSVTSGNTITGNIVYDVWKKAIEWGDHGGGIQINVGKDCAITNNEVYNVQDGQRGIYMFGSASGNTITGNILRDNEIGIQLWISGEGGTTIEWGGEVPTTPQVQFNEIYGNSSYGAISTNIAGTPMVMDATYNWWGDVTGPYHELTNPFAAGDRVSDNVNYDPWIGQEGMVTGGGWIISPEGAYTSEPSLYGQATFGFVSMYKKGADIPTGKTQFNFQVADLNFHSDSYEWLVIAGPKAIYKGTGTINGTGDYGFMLSAIDEKLTSSTDVDMFRIKIWDKDTDSVIYDNKQDGEDGTVVAGGQIVIHKGK